LAELVIVIAIIAMLVALLLPALSRAKTAALHIRCKSNVRQIGVGLRLYVDEFQKYPLETFYDSTTELPSAKWKDLLFPYCGANSKVFFCPAWGQPPDWPTTYGYNCCGTDAENVEANVYPALGLGILRSRNTAVPDSLVLAPSDMLAIGDGYGGWPAGFGWPGQCGSGWHGDWRSNAVFCDGHVETSNTDRVPHYKDAASDSWLFKPDEAHAKRWNNDNQPHPETWPQN
jgi:prepilin-type processing-associated H-X9-DG protein